MHSVRPERIQLADGTGALVAGSVEDVQYLGAELRVRVALDIGGRLVAAVPSHAARRSRRSGRDELAERRRATRRRHRRRRRQRRRPRRGRPRAAAATRRCRSSGSHDTTQRGMTMRLSRMATAVIVASALIVASCGDDDDDDTEPAGSASPVTEAPATTHPAATTAPGTEAPGTTATAEHHRWLRRRRRRGRPHRARRGRGRGQPDRLGRLRRGRFHRPRGRLGHAVRGGHRVRRQRQAGQLVRRDGAADAERRVRRRVGVG